MFLLVHTEYSHRTPADDKPLLHHLDWSYHHTLSPIVHCYRPPVCQRSLLFGLSCLPASGLPLTMNTCQGGYWIIVHGCIIMIHLHACTVLLEYFADEKPLQINQVSRKIDPLRSLLRSSEDRVYLLVLFRFCDFIVANRSTLAKLAYVWCILVYSTVVRYTLMLLPYSR